MQCGNNWTKVKPKHGRVPVPSKEKWAENVWNNRERENYVERLLGRLDGLFGGVARLLHRDARLGVGPVGRLGRRGARLALPETRHGLGRPENHVRTCSHRSTSCFVKRRSTSQWWATWYLCRRSWNRTATTAGGATTARRGTSLPRCGSTPSTGRPPRSAR